MRRALARAAFADRLPAAIVNETRKGYQAADWHEGLTAARDELGGELGRIEACGDAGATVDPAMMRDLAENMPAEGWHKPATTRKYRLALAARSLCRPLHPQGDRLQSIGWRRGEIDSAPARMHPASIAGAVGPDQGVAGRGSRPINWLTSGARLQRETQRRIPLAVTRNAARLSAPAEPSSPGIGNTVRPGFFAKFRGKLRAQ
jgi:hypothetical protein